MLYIQIYKYYTYRHIHDIDASMTHKRWRYRPSSGTSTTASCPYLSYRHIIYIYVICTYIIVSYIQTHWWYRRIKDTGKLTIQTQQGTTASCPYLLYIHIIYIYVIHTYIIVSYIHTYWRYRHINDTDTLTMQTQKRHEHHSLLPVSIKYAHCIYICYIIHV